MADPATVLLTRPRAQSEAFARKLRDRFGAAVRVLISPLIEIACTGVAVETVGVQAVAVTSANGIACLGDPAALSGMPVYCVGRRTAEAARDAGLSAHAADGDVAALVEMLSAALDPAAGPILYLRGEHVAADFAGAMAARGFEVIEVVTYRQQALPLSGAARTALEAGEVACAPLFSPRTARLFAEQCTAAGIGPAALPPVVCISENAASALGHGAKPTSVIAASADVDGMLAAIAQFLDGNPPKGDGSA